LTFLPAPPAFARFPTLRLRFFALLGFLGFFFAFTAGFASGGRFPKPENDALAGANSDGAPSGVPRQPSP